MQTVDPTCSLSNLNIRYYYEPGIIESKIEKLKWNEK